MSTCQVEMNLNELGGDKEMGTESGGGIREGWRKRKDGPCR